MKSQSTEVVSKWISALNAVLDRPVLAGSREDELALEAFLEGRKVSEAATVVARYRATHSHL